MKNSQLTRIAEQVGASSSAVSKVLNHCHGVGSELRERILDAAEAEGISGRERVGCRVYVILPETPSYFWRRFYDHLAEALTARGLEAKFNIYSLFGDRVPVERYLDEAEAMEASVVILAAHHPGITERLSALAADRLVMMTIDGEDATNVFFVGSDHYADGRKLAERCLAEHPGAERLLVIRAVDKVPLVDDDARLRGFADGVAALSHERILMMGNFSRNDTPTDLARMLDGTRRTGVPDAVICLDGFTEKVCMALKKCRMDIPCYGFESPPVDGRYPKPVGEICQELDAIAERLAGYAEAYMATGMMPEAKHIYVESAYRKRT